MEALDLIRNDTSFNRESITKATGLFHSITQCEFITALVICREGLSYTRGVTTKLQGRSIELMEAYQSVAVVTETIEKVRLQVEEYHGLWFKDIEKMAEKLSVEVKVPRLCGRQINRSNVPADSPEEYFRKSITIPFLDHMIQELTSRFCNIEQRCIAMGQSVIPEKMKQCTEWRMDFKKFADAYTCDLHSEHTVNAELDMWEMAWRDKSYLPSTSQETLKLMDRELFPNIALMLRVMCTIPVTTCECERSVSALRCLKTYMRSSMSQDRLTGLALLHVHYSMEIDINEVVNIFGRKHPRRLTLTNILNTD